MQQKLQSILFFTFIICVHISYINSIRIKSKFKNQISISANSTNTTNPTNDSNTTDVTNTPAPESVDTTNNSSNTNSNHHVHRRRRNNTKSIQNLGNPNNTQAQEHRNQFMVHHVVPNNLTELNNKAREKFAEAHQKLDQLTDVQKENLERRLFRKFPQKPIGVTSAAVINLRKGVVSQKSQDFNITSIQDLSKAIQQENLVKNSTVTVNGNVYKLRKIGLNFFYGGIVNKGGIAAYVRNGYVLVITHNNYISFSNFAFVFGQVVEGLRDNKNTLEYYFFKDNYDQKVSQIKSRLMNDHAKYVQERQNTTSQQ